MNVSHPAWIEVNLKTFKKNLQLIKNFVAPAKVCLTVKADAYGHGLIPIAKSAEEAGIDLLAVAHSSEGVALRSAGVKSPILVLGAIHEDQLQDLLKQDLQFTLASKYKAQLVAKAANLLQQTCRVHLEVDTGMHRTGVRVDSLKEVFDFVQEQPCFELEGIYSHFASSDDPLHPETTQKQLNDFLKATEALTPKKPFLRHIANSGGVCYHQQTHLDMVRCGILTFGGFFKQEGPLAGLRPIFELKAHVAYFKVVQPNQGISYGHTFKTKTQTRIVTIPVGYGDGYRRALSNKGSVLIRGKRYPIVGRVCMDQFMVDIGQGEAYVGDEAVLIGKQGDEEISVHEIADLCDTIPYEILCGFQSRLPRRYLP